MTALVQRAVSFLGGFEGSTRPVSLIRIGIPLVLLSEWGDQLLLVRDSRPVSAVIALSTFLSLALLLAGFRSRLAAAWTAASITAVLVHFGHGHGRDVISHHTHLLMLATWLLALTPCGGSFSVDRWLAVRRARRAGVAPPPEWGALWAQRLFAVLVSSVYLWSAGEKLSPAFLGGARLEQLYLYYYAGSAYPTAPMFHASMVALSWLTIAVEYFVAIGAWLPRTRKVALGVGVLFHLALYVLLPVSTFSALMILLYLAYLDPDGVHRVIDDVVVSPAPAPPPLPPQLPR